MKTININGENYTIEELTAILEKAKQLSPMDEVYAYHKTTEKEFEELYKNVSQFSKFQERERMIVDFYNKGVVPTLKDKKWVLYLNEDNTLGVAYSGWTSYVSARLCFLRESDAKNAKERFLKEYKESRL